MIAEKKNPVCLQIELHRRSLPLSHYYRSTYSFFFLETRVGWRNRANRYIMWDGSLLKQTGKDEI